MKKRSSHAKCHSSNNNNNNCKNKRKSLYELSLSFVLSLWCLVFLFYSNLILGQGNAGTFPFLFPFTSHLFAFKGFFFLNLFWPHFLFLYFVGHISEIFPRFPVVISFWIFWHTHFFCLLFCFCFCFIIIMGQLEYAYTG